MLFRFTEQTLAKNFFDFLMETQDNKIFDRLLAPQVLAGEYVSIDLAEELPQADMDEYTKRFTSIVDDFQGWLVSEKEICFELTRLRYKNYYEPLSKTAPLYNFRIKNVRICRLVRELENGKNYYLFSGKFANEFTWSFFNFLFAIKRTRFLPIHEVPELEHFIRFSERSKKHFDLILYTCDFLTTELIKLIKSIKATDYLNFVIVDTKGSFTRKIKRDHFLSRKFNTIKVNFVG